MGLDVSVMRPKMVDVVGENGYTYRMEDNPELEIFKDFAIDKTNTYYDIEGELKKLGHELDDLEWISTEYGRNVSMVFINTKHELYEAHKFLREVWSKCYFETKKELLKSEEYKKFLEFLPLLKKYGYRPLYKFFATGSQKTYYTLNSATRFVERKVKIKLTNPSTYDKVEKCVICDEVGYQRKGANTKFYEEGMWGGPMVVDSKTLNEHWNKYFSEQTPDSVGGWGSETEYNLENDEMRNRFKENIIDKFVEGETFVVYQ